jgi:protein-tyrosine phosphatase
LVRELIYCRIPLTDGGGNSQEQLSLAIESVAALLQRKVPCFVYCGAGMSRSPAIVAAPVSLVDRQSPEEALQRLIRGQPHDVSPALWRDICDAIRKQ